MNPFVLHSFSGKQRSLFRDSGSLYTLHDRAWKKLGNGYISLIHNSYNASRVLLSLESSDCARVTVYQMKPKTKKKGQTWILKGVSTLTSKSSILAVRFSDIDISSHFENMLEFAAKLRRKHTHTPDAYSNDIFRCFFDIEWVCPLCKSVCIRGSHKCKICLTPQSDVADFGRTRDEFVGILDIISKNRTRSEFDCILQHLMRIVRALLANVSGKSRSVDITLSSGVDMFYSCLGFREDAPAKKYRCPDHLPHIYSLLAAKSAIANSKNWQLQTRHFSQEMIGEIPKSFLKMYSYCTPQKCVHIARILSILKYYQKWRNQKSKREGGMYDYIASNASNQYDNANLLADYRHILHEHAQYKCNTMSCDGKDDEPCNIMQRNGRDRGKCDRNSRKKLYFGFNSSFEVNTQQLCDQIHCYLLHPNTVQSNDKFSFLRFPSLKQETVKNSDKHRRFKSLKQEMFDNEYCNIAPMQWQDLVLKSKDIIRSLPNMQLLSDHVISVLLYCNFAGMARHLQRTLREQTLPLEFANWAQTLQSAVQALAVTNVNCPKHFYVCIDDPQIIPNIDLQLNGPQSATSDKSVACECLQNRNGLIMQFTPITSKCKHFLNCDWISDFANEKETLFLSSNNALQTVNARVCDMIHVKCNKNYKNIIDAVTALQTMLDDCDKPINEETLQILMGLCASNANDTESIENRLFTAFCESVKNVSIQNNNKLFDFENKLFSDLLTNLEEIQIEFQENISPPFFAKILKFLQNNSVNVKLKKVVINNPIQKVFTMQTAIDEHHKLLKKQNWGIAVNQIKNQRQIVIERKTQ